MKKCLKCGSTQYTAEGSENGDILICMNCGNDEFIENSPTAEYKQFSVKVSYKGNKLWDASDPKFKNYNNNMVKVTNKEIQQSITFEYWTSISKPIITEDKEILFSFYCFVSDAVSGYESFKDFCSNCGYDTDSRKAEKIHRKCKKAYEKLQKIYDGDIYDLVNELQEVTG